MNKGMKSLERGRCLFLGLMAIAFLITGCGQEQPASEEFVGLMPLPIEDISQEISSIDSLGQEPDVLEGEEEPNQESPVGQEPDVLEGGEPQQESPVEREPDATAGETDQAPGPFPEETADNPETISEGNGFLVVIDAGHQGKGNKEKEPVGPGASEMKAKVSSGTSGCVSGWAEYELNLAVALKLRDELEDRGYQVIMVRESHDVDISNSERAAIANDAGADAFIRIHANGSEDSSVSGAMTICQTKDNPYNGSIYQSCRDLSDCVLDELVAAAGCKKRKVWETDTMSGINWCQVPVTIVEMGYMTNAEEDALMATQEYQDKLVTGIANGVDRFLDSYTD